MTSSLKVLGSCGGWPEAGRACSGFLLEHECTRIVLDLGYGTFPRLLDLLGSPTAEGVDAVVITHAHPDHFVDLHALFRARWYGRPGAKPLPLYAADGVLALIANLEEGADEAVETVFDTHRLPAGPYAVGPFLLHSWTLPHYVTNAGVRLSAPGLTVAYTGDTGPDANLADLGRHADLFIIDATDRDQTSSRPRGESRLNLTGEQAGRAGAAAGARRLLLTHFWPGNDRATTHASAAEYFTGEILLAEEGLHVSLP